MDAEKLMMQKRIDNLSEMLEKYQDAIVPSLRERIEKLERERDALMFDFKGYVRRPKKVCLRCKNRNKPICNMCEGCDLFEWRGLCKENGGVEE
jgi:hypothetical protein